MGRSATVIGLTLVFFLFGLVGVFILLGPGTKETASKDSAPTDGKSRIQSSAVKTPEPEKPAAKSPGKSPVTASPGKSTRAAPAQAPAERIPATPPANMGAPRITPLGTVTAPQQVSSAASSPSSPPSTATAAGGTPGSIVPAGSAPSGTGTSPSGSTAAAPPAAAGASTAPRPVATPGDTRPATPPAAAGTLSRSPADTPSSQGGLPPSSGVYRSGTDTTAGSRSVTGAAPAAATDTTYTVLKDENLWKIAEKFYKDGTRWTVIRDANPELGKEGQVREGHKLRIPPAPPVTPPVAAVTLRAAPPAGMRAYTVRTNDRLWDIARTFYGSGVLYKEILAANPGLDSDRLPVGKDIYLPVIAGKSPREPSETAQAASAPPAARQ